MNPARRREMVDREHPSLPIVGQCALLGGEPLQHLCWQPSNMGHFESREIRGWMEVRWVKRYRVTNLRVGGGVAIVFHRLEQNQDCFSKQVIHKPSQELDGPEKTNPRYELAYGNMDVAEEFFVCPTVEPVLLVPTFPEAVPRPGTLRPFAQRRKLGVSLAPTSTCPAGP